MAGSMLLSETRTASGWDRRVFNDAVQWVPGGLIGNPDVAEWDYAVFRFPFVPGFHVCLMEGDDDTTQEFILTSHKLLHEAMDLCKLLLANGGIHYE